MITAELDRERGVDAAGDVPKGSCYGFQGRLSAVFPSQVIVDVTEVCNLECVHCPHPVFRRSERYGARRLSRELNEKVVDEVRRDGAGHARYIRYTANGEPLAHPELFEMLGYASRRSGVWVTLTTNGTLLDEARSEKLLASGLQLVDVSLDAASGAVYRRIRVKGDFGRTRANVRQLLELKRRAGSATKIVVSFVEQDANRGEAGAFERYWRAEGVDEVVIRRLHSAAGGVESIAREMSRGAAARPRRPCLYPWERVLLNPAGWLSFCPQDWEHGSWIADFRQSTILETWRSEAYRRLREAHLRNDFSCHGFCGKCADWQATRWPFEGRSYADMIQDFSGKETGAARGACATP